MVEKVKNAVIVFLVILGILTAKYACTGEVKNPIREIEKKTVTPIKRAVKYIKYGDHRIPNPDKISKVKLNIGEVFFKEGGIGLSYEMFNLGDFSFNIGINPLSPYININYALDQHLEFGIGTQGVNFDVRL